MGQVRGTLHALTIATLATTMACDSPPVARPGTIEAVPITETRSLPGLSGPVDVVFDTRGIPHIYATSFEDAIRAEGYVMAVDRFAQMELFRRGVRGEVAEFAGRIEPQTINDDIAARVVGHRRSAERILATLDVNGPERRALDAFAAGVNVYIAELRARTAPVYPGSEVLELVLATGGPRDWSAVDTLAIGRRLSADLSEDSDEELARTASLAALEDELADDEEFWSRFWVDFYWTGPSNTATPATALPGAGPRMHRAPSFRAPRIRLPNRDVLARGVEFFDLAARRRLVRQGSDFGSNNWGVMPSRSETGNALLANDPHLDLVSPPLFYYAHLDTKRAGGDVEVGGLALVGVPGIILGYTRDVAWAVTTASFDVVDVYSEEITNGGASVRFRGADVAIERVRETVAVDGRPPRTVDIEVVPHHGPIVPTIRDGAIVPRSGNTALSFRWTGFEASNEIGAFLALNRARDLDSALSAVARFEVGAQNFVIVDRAGHLGWSTHARVPRRQPASRTWNALARTGYTPCMVLPGNGDHEWNGVIPAERLPQARDPEAGFLATANGDPVGVAADGDGTDGDEYLDCGFIDGHREGRILELLAAHTRDGGRISPAEMSAIQADDYSALGSRFTPVFLAALDRAAIEAATPGTHGDLAAIVATLSTTTRGRLADVRNRLAAWTFHTPDGVVGSPPEAAVADSIATSLFNVALARLTRLAFDDELESGVRRPDSDRLARVLERSLLRPATLANPSAYWDDRRTTELETRDERIVRAVVLALEFLDMELGRDITAWRWGRLHRITFEAGQVPQIADDILTIPGPGDAMFPRGYPRKGDLFSVDASNYQLYTWDNFTYDSGPQERVVVEMTATGPNVWNALPGGQSLDPARGHIRDEAALWLRNEAPPIPFNEGDVVARARRRVRLLP